jgi:lipopolysaccharide biosynthesis glycosyltransferase
MIVPALFVACSVARHSRPDRDYDLAIVTPPDELDDRHRDFAASHGILVDDSIAMERIGDIVVSEARLSNATLLKLLLPGHFASRYDKILYLDADLTVHDDLSRLFAIDMRVHPLAAGPGGRVLSDLSQAQADQVRAHFAELGMTAPYRYFNTGVLLISSAHWLEARVTERALDFLRKHPQLCALPDEDSLNAVLDGDILALSPIWNSFAARLWASPVQPVIIQYAGAAKPWKRFGRYKRPGSQRDAYRLYRDFIAGTPWPDFLRSQWTWRDVIGSLVCEAEHWLRLLMGRTVARRSARAKRFVRDLRDHYANARFIDVEQGIAVREHSTIRGAQNRQSSALRG